MYIPCPKNRSKKVKDFHKLFCKNDFCYCCSLITCSINVTWKCTFWNGCGVGLQVKDGIVVIEIQHLHGDGGAGAEPRLGLLLCGNHHQQKLPLIGVFKVKFLK